MDNSRNKALDILIEYERNGTYPNLALKKHLRGINSTRDKNFITTLVYGVIETKLTLDYYISYVSSVKLSKINVVVLTILRMGLYQIIYLSTPVSAACNTSVDLAKKNGQFKSSGFVNAILRKLSITYRDISLPKNDSIEHFKIKYSINTNIANTLIKSLGIDGFVNFMESKSKIDSSIYAVINSKKTTVDNLLLSLKEDGVNCQSTRYDNLLKLSGHVDIEHTSSFKLGLFHVITLPSYIAAYSLNPKYNDTVLDMCAAPGGKTFTIYSLTNGQVDVTAFDLHEHKIKSINKECMRLGITNINTNVANSSKFKPEFENYADCIICDVPCSGLGMIFKKPDIKYNNTDFESLTKLQFEILSNAACYLKSGGRLVYSTCTVNIDENDAIIDNFLKLHSEFSIDKSVQIYDNCYGVKTFLPHIDNIDGFYIAVLKKD